MKLILEVIASMFRKLENSIRFITGEDNAIELAAEIGLVTPVEAEDGSIYTDENGVLYTL